MELREKCGIFGVYGRELPVSRLVFAGLLSLQHRGQESAGLAVTDGNYIWHHAGPGLVADVLKEWILDQFEGHIAVGHNRYSTSQGTDFRHAQPVAVEESLVIAHNGNLPSTAALENFLDKEGISTKDLSDSALMAEAINSFVRQGMPLAEAVSRSFPLFTGSFSLLVMDKNNLIAVRDRCGIKPLSIGRLDGGYVISSETCTFAGIGAVWMRDVAPGEMIVVNDAGVQSKILAPADQKLDVFEFVYFASPASVLLGRSVYAVRKNCGKELAKETKIEADVVIPVPQTALPGAIGYAEESGIPFELGLIRNHYIHRTFIEPDQGLRQKKVDMKLAVLPDIVDNKRVVLVDDSIVRGTTSKKIIKKVFDAGAKEVHFVINSPPVRFPDFYGIDTPKQNELLAFEKSVEEMNSYLGSTSLHFLSYEGLIRGVGVSEDQLCTSCFTGRYPVDILERKKEVQGII